MDFRPPPRPRADENLLPMINVVFLLLIFFLISARLTPPAPLEVIPPEARTEAEADGQFTLYLAAEGQMAAQDGAEDAAALAALTQARAGHCAQVDCAADPPRLTLRADAGLPAARLAALLPRLAALGFDRIDLVAIGRGGPDRGGP